MVTESGSPRTIHVPRIRDGIELGTVDEEPIARRLRERAESLVKLGHTVELSLLPSLAFPLNFNPPPVAHDARD